MIEKNGVRILTPFEFDRLLNAITKQDYKILLNVALYTGARYVELQRLQKHPEWLKMDRRCIYFPREAQRKKKRKLKDRYVYLTSAALNYIPLFFKIRKLPLIQQWNQLLKAWAEKAGIGGDGISAKTTRKTWESWLAVSYPDRLDHVCMNQGHTNLIAMRHYLQLPFTDDEKREIKNRTVGWMDV
jgi:integrase